MLTFFDEVTNTVLMPVCALFACITAGWIIKPERVLKELEEGGTPIPDILRATYPVMIRFITPLLILIVEVGGIKAEIEAGNYAVIAFAFILVLICVAIYFIFFKNTYTGVNADEVIADYEESEHEKILEQYNEFMKLKRPEQDAEKYRKQTAFWSGLF